MSSTNTVDCPASEVQFNRLYSIALFAYLFQLSLFQAEPNFSLIMREIAAICLYVSVLVSLFIVVRNIIRTPRFPVLQGVIVSFSIFFFVSYHYNLIPLSLLICASANVSHDRIVRTCYKSLVFILSFFLLMWFLGVANDQLSERSLNKDFDNEVMNIHTFGFIHYFCFSLRVLSASILYLYLKRNGVVKNYVYLILIVINVSVYYLTYTRLHILLFWGFLIAYILYYKIPYINFKKPKHKIVGMLAYPICQIFFLVILVAPFAGFEDIRELWDSVFSKRMVSTLYFLSEYGINMFGNEISMAGIGTAADTGDSEFFLDAGFAYWLIAFGLLYTFFILVSYTYLFYRAYSKQNWALYIWLFVFCIGNFINDFFSNADINPVILLLFADLSDEVTEPECETENINYEEC